MLISILMSKIIFMKYSSPVRPKLVPKLKMLRIDWNLAHLTFQISRSWFWSQILFLLNFYHMFGRNWSQNYSEFIEIWAQPIFQISRSQFWCQKYLPPVRPKLVPKFKVLRIFSNLVHSIVQICQSQFWCQKWFLWNISTC